MSEAIFHKTEAGGQALQDRSRCPALTPRLRSLLLQVDGKRGGAELRELGRALGAPDDGLATLLTLGLVAADGATPASPSSPAASAAPTGPAGDTAAAPADAFARLQEATRLMNKAAADHMGLKALFFTLKVEKAANREELLGLLGDLRAAIAKSRDAGQADRLVDEIRALLAG
ncbi:hypothetical protein [Chitinimonas koreensis]|uniref:hypothetical protein n=1 Tax=Chitinimonas koreensis TaxID=356302 RepID=UPI000401CE52|nr:hypothetical protein [Chitinimonas koreensis]QNM94984.1 hypothetical protein H9L41_13785 [Chitinimonas koreensis]